MKKISFSALFGFCLQSLTKHVCGHWGMKLSIGDKHVYFHSESEPWNGISQSPLTGILNSWSPIHVRMFVLKRQGQQKVGFRDMYQGLVLGLGLLFMVIVSISFRVMVYVQGQGWVFVLVVGFRVMVRVQGLGLELGLEFLGLGLEIQIRILLGVTVRFKVQGKHLGLVLVLRFMVQCYGQCYICFLCEGLRLRFRDKVKFQIRS